MSRTRTTWRRHPGTGRAEHGYVALEFVLATGVLVLPMVILALSLPIWVERMSMARVAAQEAARAVALAPDAARGGRRGTELVGQTARNHDVAPEDASVCYSVHDLADGAPERCTGLTALPRGAAVTAAVTIRLPMIRLPFLAQDLGVLPPYTARHTERVDLYRSF
ncbi:MAG: hypothetical protein ABR592_01765 [Nitriliruptorales bacterium]